MVWSAEGFPVPSVEETSCVECGVCVTKCIALESPPMHDDNLDAVESYGAWNRNAELHRISSSGGIFTALAEYILAQSGCVFGVIWQDKETAMFSKAENRKELAAMRGSKYTPAMPGYVYRDVQDALKAGHHVLFSGTPCQVHALKVFLKRDYERLVTLDIACHGVPSRLVLQKYIRELEVTQGCELAQISFRDKSTGWSAGRYSLVHRFVNGESVYRKQGESLFMRMFLCDAALNRSCYNCPYAHSPRQGDLSVGDYWGVENHHPDWPLGEGVSTLIVNSEQGRKVLEKITESLHLHAEPFTHIYEQNRHVYAKAPGRIHPNRPYTMVKLQEKGSSLQDALEQATRYSFIMGVRFRNDHFTTKCLRCLKRLITKYE